MEADQHITRLWIDSLDFLNFQRRTIFVQYRRLEFHPVNFRLVILFSRRRNGLHRLLLVQHFL